MKRDESVTGQLTRQDLEQLEVADPATGQLGRVVTGRPIRVPERVWVEGRRLRWWWGGAPAPAKDSQAVRGGRIGVQMSWLPLFRNRLVFPSKEMLREFISLGSGPDSNVLAFAKRWGPLGICKHGVPHTHWPLTPWNEHVRSIRGTTPLKAGAGDPRPAEHEVLRPWCHPQGTEETWRFGGWEPLAAWRMYASEAFTIVKVASQLHRNAGQPVSLDRKTILALTGQDWLSRDTLSDRMEVGWEVIQPALDRWLGLGDVRIYLHPLQGNTGLAIRLGTAGSPINANVSVTEVLGPICGLFGALAVQLLLCVNNRGGLAICSECQCTYEPERRPRRDAAPLCPDCEPKARARLRSRKYRAKRSKEASTAASLPQPKSARKGARSRPSQRSKRSTPPRRD